jgi:drug/metabolite transporter (DMT)-like permease
MNTGTMKSNGLLLITAAIWGFAFVAQRVGMDFVGPYTFNGVRFALGSLSLIPLLVFTANGSSRRATGIAAPPGLMKTVAGGALAGAALFLGASFQQVGLVYTTAGNAGFITGLYVVIVPLMGLIWGQRPGLGTWVGAILATVGLYFLSVTDSFTIAYGDFLELVGAFFWAGHVHIIGWLSRRIHPLRIAFVQFATCSTLSLVAAILLEDITWAGIEAALLPILYGGLMSVGIAYTLQVVAQKEAHPAHAAIILSLEAVFAALGGWMLLNELLSLRGMLGCALMLAGMLLSQVGPMLLRKKTKAADPASATMPS